MRTTITCNFRLGTTSYILPTHMISNVQFLAPRVDDIELLFFESEIRSDMLHKTVLDNLAELAIINDLTYTVHLPLDINLGSYSEFERKQSVDTCRRIIDRISTLNPFAYIIHCNACEESPDKYSPHELHTWQKNISKSLQSIAGIGINPELLCIENLHYPFHYIYPVIEDLDVSICLDIGHIIHEGYSLLDYLELYMPRTKVMHLHGTADGKDHKSISYMEKCHLDSIFTFLYNNCEIDRVITLEVFNLKDLENSLAEIKRWVSWE